MDIKKLAPWNWFKKEEEEAGGNVPVKMTETQSAYPEGSFANPLVQLHREMDRLFEHALRGFGVPPASFPGISPFGTGLNSGLAASGILKPQVDIGATEREYTITVEVPGVAEKDVMVEIADNNMTIRGEKKQEREEQDKNYYKIERSYGSFQRVLSLPDDADQKDARATFKNGVLTIRMGRRTLPKSTVKQVEVKAVD